MPPTADPTTAADIWAILSSIGTLLAGIGTVGLMFLAVGGLRQWRAQLVGTSRYEIARKLAHFAVRWRSEMAQARSPLTLGHESMNRQRGSGESPEEAQIHDEYYARSERLKPVFDTMRNLESAGWEAEVILGPVVRQQIAEIEKVVTDYAWTMAYYFEDRLSALHNPREQLTPAQEEEAKISYRKVYGGGTNDPLAADINRAVDGLLTYLRQFI